MTKGKVCMLTTEHSALDVRIFYKEARSLKQAGYDVTIISPLRNGSLVAMGGKPLGATELDVDGIHLVGFNSVIRGTPRMRALARWIKLATIGKFDWLCYYDDLMAKAVATEADVYHCHEIDSICAGFRVQKVLAERGKKVRLVYDSHEFTPAGHENVKRKWLRSLFRNLIIHFESSVAHRVSAIVVTNQIQRGYFLSLNPFALTEVFYNTREVIKKTDSSKKASDRITLCYVGYLRFYRGLREMIDVLRFLDSKYPGRIALLIVGNLDGAERQYAEEKITEYGLQDCFRVTNWLPREKVDEAMMEADIAITFPTPTENDMMCTPNKLFDYMAHGMPIVATNVPGISYLLTDTGAGIPVTEWSVEALARAISGLIEDEQYRKQMGDCGRQAIANAYGLRKMSEKLIQLYEHILVS